MATQHNFRIKNGLDVNGTERISAAGASTPQSLTVVADASVGGNLVVTGDLTVNGSNTIINTATLAVEDKNITLNYHASSDTSGTANGSGITIQDAIDASTDATILWDASNDEFDFSHGVNITSGNFIVDTDTLYVKASNDRVGINNSFPLDALDVMGSIRFTGDLKYTANSPMDIKQTTSDQDILFWTTAAGASNTEKMRIEAGGNVGINTTGPSRKLHIKDHGQIKLENTSTDAWAGLDIHTSVGTNDYDMYMGMLDSDGRFFIDVNSNGEDLTILQNGNVGIGSTSPDNTLDLGSATGGRGISWNSYSNIWSEYSNASLWLGSNIFPNIGAAGYKVGATGNFGAAAIQVHGTGGSGNSGVIKLYTDTNTSKTAGNAFTPTLRMIVEPGGHIGMGTPDPEGQLHVRSSDNEVMISDMSASSGSFTWQSFRRNNTNKFRVFGDSNDSQFGFYNDATGSSAGYYPFTITTGNNSTGSNYVGLNTNAPAKPLHIKRTSGWATVRLEGASDSGGELEFYAGSTLKAKLWAENTNGDIYIRAGGANTTAILAEDGNWVGPHEDNVKRNFIGRGPFNVFDFSDNWHEFYNPASNTEHHLGNNSFTNAMGVTMTFPSNVTKKILQHDRTPTGTVGVVMEMVSDSSNTWNGGWNSGQFRTDPDKGYIFGYYCKRITSASNGTHYAGFSHGIAAGTGTNVDSNPYFQSFGNGNLPIGVWTLHYYHLHPRYYSGTGDGGIGGVYRCDTGVRILGQTAWKQPVNQTYQVFRTYNYYCANPSVSIQWYAPFVYEVNGHEPTPAALLVNT